MVSGERPHQQLRAVIDGKAAWDEGLWRDLQAFGLTMLLVPEADGGAGLTMVELALIAEVLGYAGAAVPFLGHTLATLALVKGGDEEQKARWLPALAAGEVIGSVALPDAADGWAPAEWSLAGQGARLTGRKINVPHGQLADIMIVGLAGGGLGVVDCKSEGMTVRAMDSLDLTRPLAAVEFSDAPVTVLANGVAAAEDVSNAALVLLAADAFGGSNRILDMARDYTLVREAFGATLAQFQGIKHQLANMALEIEPTRGLYWIAAYAFEHWPDRVAQMGALAKAHTAEVFLQSTRMGTELHGGIGFTWEYDAHIWLKRAMFDYAWGGRPERLLERAADLAGW
jgi:acyl-CoA dehydrogenase